MAKVRSLLEGTTRSLLDIEQIKEVAATDLSHMIGCSGLSAKKVHEILYAAANYRAGHLHRAFWDTDEEQRLFNVLAAVMANSSIVKR